MRKRALQILCAVVLGVPVVTARAATPDEPPLPPPAQLGRPTEAPPPFTIKANNTTVAAAPNVNTASQPPVTNVVVDNHGNDDCDCNKPRGYWTVGAGVY